MAKEVANTTDNTPTRPTEGFMEYLARRARQDGENRNYEIAASQLDQILSAETPEQMWAADDFDSTAGKDLEDLEMRVDGFTVHESSAQYVSTLGFYVMVSAVRLSDMTQFVFNTGSPLIIGKLRWLEAAELLGTPDAECIIKGTDTSNGRVLKLKPIPQRAAQASAQ